MMSMAARSAVALVSGRDIPSFTLTPSATSSPSDATPKDLTQFPPSLRGRRILLCTESFGPVNGVSRTTLMLVNHLRAHGAQVAVVAPHNHTMQNTFSPPVSPGLTPEGAELLQPEYRVGGYPLPFNPELSIVYPVRNTTLFERTFGKDRLPDLIYLASPASLGFQVMVQLRQQPKERQIPIICNFQTDLAGYCKILFPAPLSHFGEWTFSVVQSLLFRHSSVKTIFYPSRFVAKYLKDQRVQEEKLEILTRGVKTDVFKPCRRSEALRAEIMGPDAGPDHVIFVTVCRISGEKGFDFLAKVARMMDKRGVSFTLYVVGGNRNPEVEREVHETFDPELRASRKVIFAGQKVGENLAEAYASADVFLHCSITETFGLVVLESMASGVPVVARDEGGPSDIVTHGETGYLVPPDDLEGFVSKALKLAYDSKLRRAMGVEARKAACNATWEKINNKVAWRMADTIAEREMGASKPREKKTGGAVHSMWSLVGSLIVSAAMRQQARDAIVDARLATGLAIIFGFGVLVGVYIVFMEVTIWIKGKINS